MKTKKRFGQHLLKDPDDARRIALALPVAQESILEIGPGAGALTAALLDSHPQAVVTAVEFDRDMVALLERRFKDEPRLRVVQGDILTYDPAPHGTELTVAGNLPYNISAPVLDWTVKNCKVIARALFMLQREVADRLASEPGSKDWSPLAIMTQLSYEIKSEFTLG
ncbi:MAG: ribosomal RNA small subunit methyltransferase A, partial [Candidatus Zixiibacteriota bacterium]